MGQCFTQPQIISLIPPRSLRDSWPISAENRCSRDAAAILRCHLNIGGQRLLVLNGVRISDAFLGTRHRQNSSRGMSMGVVNLESTLTRHVSRTPCFALCMQESVLVGRLHPITPPAIDKRQSFWMTWSRLSCFGWHLSASS